MKFTARCCFFSCLTAFITAFLSFFCVHTACGRKWALWVCLVGNSLEESLIVSADYINFCLYCNWIVCCFYLAGTRMFDWKKFWRWICKQAPDIQGFKVHFIENMLDEFVTSLYVWLCISQRRSSIRSSPHLLSWPH